MKTRIKFLGVHEFDKRFNCAIEINNKLYRTDLYNIWVPNTVGVLKGYDVPLEGIEIEAEIKEFPQGYNGNTFFFPDDEAGILPLIVGDLTELKRAAKAQIAANTEVVLQDAQTYREAMQKAETESEWNKIRQSIEKRLIEGLSPFLLEKEKYRIFWEYADEFCTQKYGIGCRKWFSGTPEDKECVTLHFPYGIIDLEKEIAKKAEWDRICASYEITKFHKKVEPRGGEDGRDGYYEFDVLDKTDGKTYVFIWRDVFDFGSWGFPFRKGIDQFKEETWTEKERDIYKFVCSKFPGGIRM